MNERKQSSKQNRSGWWIILVAAASLEAISCVQYFTSRAAIMREAQQRVQNELRNAELKINTVTIEMEAAAKMLTTLAERHLDNPDSLANATRVLLQTIDNVSSAGIACQPYLFPQKGRWYEVCSSRDTCDGQPCIYTRQIGSAAHNYFETEWYNNGLTIDSCWWSEPYFDDSGARTMIVSCTHPIRDKQGNIVAVTCVDLSLDYLQDLSQFLKVYEDSYYSISSNEGLAIVPIEDTVPGRKYQIFDEEIDATGWHISIVIPEELIYAELNRIGRIVGLLMILGLALLVFIVVRSRKDTNRLVEFTARNQKMENELQIARAIQMAMLQKVFPPFTDHPDLNIYGLVNPAKEVGGDLYDFFIRHDKLFFCVGDVSGKGVPAALVMAMTNSLFRSISAHEEQPEEIVSLMNRSFTEQNTQNMFLTLFLGVLDLTTGRLDYCNAGHNAPVLLSGSGQPNLDVLANLPLGIVADFPYQAQSVQLSRGDLLFLYTDGLTEAENINHDQFGEQRMIDILTSLNTTRPRNVADAMLAAVSAFVGDAEQSDDLTMLAIRYQTPAIVMRNDIQQIPTLAEWVDALGLPEELNMPVNLALEEIVSNVMLYAYPHDKSGQVFVEFTRDRQTVTFTVSDSGIPFDPTKKDEVDITLSAEERAIGGLGIHLVRQLMDEISYSREEEKNVLTLIKRI